MSVLCLPTLSPSGTLISKVATRQMLSFLYPIDFIHNSRHRSQRRTIVAESRQFGTIHGRLEDWFVKSLAQAGHCRNHAPKHLRTSSFSTTNKSSASRPKSSGQDENGHWFRHSRYPEPNSSHDISKEDCPNDTRKLQPDETASETPLLDGSLSGKDVARWARLKNTSKGRTWRRGRTRSDPEDGNDRVEPRSRTRLQSRFRPNLHPKSSQDTRTELIALVDDYDGLSLLDPPAILGLSLQATTGTEPMQTVVTEEDNPWSRPHWTWPADSETKLKLLDIDLALLDERRDPEDIYQLYRSLPSPGARYLDDLTRHKLLRHLSIVERKDEHSILRYLSVVDDLKTLGIPLTSNEWTSVISFISTHASKLRTTEVEAEAALHTWREMEHVAGVQSSGATFNVLFDVACKAGKFTLAEMVYGEMARRGHGFNRFHHVSLIMYCGLRKDGSGVRAAYRNLVNSKELVDTIVLNSVISALVSSQEPASAERIYQHMRNNYLETGKLAPNSYHQRRSITATLIRLAERAKSKPQFQSVGQRKAIMSPNLQTFRILIKHFAGVGDLDKTAYYIDEMTNFHIPVHGPIFLAIFRGFAQYGGVPYSRWSEKRLESVWASLVRAIDDGVEDLHYSTWLVTWALRAFGKCSGHKRTFEVWEDIQAKWKPDERDMQFIMYTLQQVAEKADMAKARHDWVLGSREGDR